MKYCKQCSAVGRLIRTCVRPSVRKTKLIETTAWCAIERCDVKSSGNRKCLSMTTAGVVDDHGDNVCSSSISSICSFYYYCYYYRYLYIYEFCWEYEVGVRRARTTDILCVCACLVHYVPFAVSIHNHIKARIQIIDRRERKINKWKK